MSALDISVIAAMVALLPLGGLVKTTLLMKIMLQLLRGGTERALLQVIDYLMAEARVLKQRYRQDCGKRLLLNDEQRRELAEMGKSVIKHGHGHVIQIVRPDTLMRWYRRLVASKFDSSNTPRGVGRPETPPHVCKLVLRFARENRSWGYDRIAGAMKNVGHVISDQSVGNILKRHGLEPVPERSPNGTWREFVDRHLAVMWATDFFTAEVLTMRGLVTYYVLFFIHLESRKVILGRLTPHPDAAWMKQIARNVSGFDGELANARYLIHDRDSKFMPFDAVLPENLRAVTLPLRSPNLNAFAERFVLSIKSECLDRFIPLGERFLRYTIREYLAHYHTERNHQGVGIGNELLVPDERTAADRRGQVIKNSRLGGLLNFYHRVAA